MTKRDLFTYLVLYKKTMLPVLKIQEELYNRANSIVDELLKNMEDAINNKWKSFKSIENAEDYEKHEVTIEEFLNALSNIYFITIEDPIFAKHLYKIDEISKEEWLTKTVKITQKYFPRDTRSFSEKYEFFEKDYDNMESSTRDLKELWRLQ